MIKMIERLVDTGYAYVVDGHVLFDTTKYPQGVLTGQTEGRDHARIDEASYKRNQSDFVLWKPADGEVGWDSPWGAGRPGWHIECSAMISEHLGATIDIHRSDERRVGKECVSTCRSRWSPYHYKKNNNPSI